MGDFFARLTEKVDVSRKSRIAIPMAQDEACAYAVCRGVKSGLMTATLIGDPQKIREMYGEVTSREDITILEESDPTKACKKAVQLVRSGKADLLMKGLVPTSTILKAVLNSQEGLKKNPLLSHLTFFELPQKNGFKILTDVAINIAPDVETQTRIVENAVEAFRLFEDRPPKVALLAANEKVSEKVPSTVLAQSVAQAFASRKDVIVEGPISLDLSVSDDSVRIKKWQGRIKGDADIFVTPRIETGNVLYKSLQYYAQVPMGGLVYGARCPVVLTSRADDNDTKFSSMLLGILIWQLEKSGSHSTTLEAGK